MEIRLDKSVMKSNDDIAKGVRERLEANKTLMVNIVGGPGTGKTSLILKSIEILKMKTAVIEGDIESDIDAKKVAALGIPVVQINTHGGCHLNAQMIDEALKEIPKDTQIIFVENVGNLVCPSAFDIGEDFKVALSNVTEGDDKPYKYPAIFQKALAVLINKIDLWGHVNFARDYFYEGVKILNPQCEVFEVSSITGGGVDRWGGWLESKYQAKVSWGQK